MRVDPAAVHRFAKDVWRVADDVTGVRLDSMFLQGSAACEGTDLVKGLARHAEEQHEAVQAVGKRCVDFGTSLKSAAENFMRQEDENTQSFADITKSRRT